MHSIHIFSLAIHFSGSKMVDCKSSIVSYRPYVAAVDDDDDDDDDATLLLCLCDSKNVVLKRASAYLHINTHCTAADIFTVCFMRYVYASRSVLFSA